MSKPIVLLEMPKGRDTLRVSVSEFQGKKYVDVRLWYTTASGELAPTQKGVSFQSDCIVQVTDAMLNARNLL